MNAFNYRLLLIHSKLDAEVRREQTRSFPDALWLLRLAHDMAQPCGLMAR